MKWYKFDPEKGSRQKRPPEKKWVLVHLRSEDPEHIPEGVAVGYLKYAAGDRQSPVFVVPGLATSVGRVVRERGLDPLNDFWRVSCVLEWCDCLPENFEYPKQIEGAML